MPLLLPAPPDRRPLRGVVLLAGLSLYGTSVALMLRSDLGVMPWTVLDQGLALTVVGQVGTWSVVVGAALLLAWWPLHQRPGVGTLANVVVVGLTINIVMAVLAAPLPSSRSLVEGVPGRRVRYD